MRHTLCLSDVLVLGVSEAQGRLIEMIPHCPRCQRDIDDPHELTEGQTRSEWEWNGDREEHAGKLQLSGNADQRDPVTGRLAGVKVERPGEGGQEIVAWV